MHFIQTLFTHTHTHTHAHAHPTYPPHPHLHSPCPGHDSLAHIKDNYTATSAIVERLLFSGLLPPDRKLNLRMPQYKMLRVLRDHRGNVGVPAPPGSPAQTPPFRPNPKMTRGVVTATTANRDTAVARIGFDNDGFMSDRSDGGEWQHVGDQDPNRKFPVYPAMTPGGVANGSLGTPTQQSTHGLFADPDYGYAVREAPFVPVDGEMFWNIGSDVHGHGHVDGPTAAWRLREMHYTTLSLVHGFSQLDGCPTHFASGVPPVDLPACPVAGGARLNKSACVAAGCCYHPATPVYASSAPRRCTLMPGGPKKPGANFSDETIDRWRRAPLNTTRLTADRLPLSHAYAATPHTEFEYIR